MTNLFLLIYSLNANVYQCKVVVSVQQIYEYLIIPIQDFIRVAVAEEEAEEEEEQEGDPVGIQLEREQREMGGGGAGADDGLGGDEQGDPLQGLLQALDGRKKRTAEGLIPDDDFDAGADVLEEMRLHQEEAEKQTAGEEVTRRYVFNYLFFTPGSEGGGRKRIMFLSVW